MAKFTKRKPVERREREPQKPRTYNDGGLRRNIYRPEMARIAYKWLSEGFSPEVAAGQCDISFSTFRTWSEKGNAMYNEEFADAVERGKDKGRTFWEKLSRQNAKTNRGNVTGIKFNLSNRYGWKEKTELSGDQENPVRLVNVEVLKDEEKPEKDE